MKYLFPLSVIFFLGYSFLYANTQEDCKRDSLNDKVYLPGYGSIDFFQDLGTNTVSPSLKIKNEAYKICIPDNEELEEDKFLPSKKEVKSIPFFSPNPYAQKMGSWCNNINKRLFLYKHLDFFSSNKLYVIFRVFRI